MEMLIVETIAKIRPAHFAQKKPIKAICREFRVSRKVVRKVIRSEASEFHYERGKQPRPRIDPWRDQLDANADKAARERLTPHPRARSKKRLAASHRGRRSAVSKMARMRSRSPVAACCAARC